MMMARLPKGRAGAREPSRFVTARFSIEIGTKAECTETAVKQSEPMVCTPIGPIVQAFRNVTNHSESDCGAMLPVQHPPALRMTLLRFPAGACTVKLTADAG